VSAIDVEIQEELVVRLLAWLDEQARRVDLTQRLLLSPAEAAAVIGCSRDFFDAHVRDELRLVRRGRLVLVPVRELERWVDENAAKVIS
jgi:excisionase family DNA binding protein